MFCDAFLENAAGKLLVFSDPVDIVELRSPDRLEGFFRELDRRLDRGFSLAGYIGYEAGYGFEPAFEGAVSGGGDLPLAWFGVYDSTGTLVDDEGPDGREREVEAFPECLRFDTGREEYAASIERIREHIAAGDVYQVNFTGRFSFDYGGSTGDLFRSLRRKQPGAYAALLNTDVSHSVLSVSPELFFRRRGLSIETRPMKGTAPRGEGEKDDCSKKAWLGSDEKNRAENLMIVDLLRNDLGRICLPGSVETPELFVTESYPTLHQMISTIRGELRGECSLFDIFRAIFPCGSITGAPKIRAMQRIRQLEKTPRGIYTGALGYMLPDRSMCFNVAIRTAVLSGRRGEYGAGSGIVWDSDADAEYGECRLKARILEGGGRGGDFLLFESVLYNGVYVWLDEHIERMAESARVLGLGFDRKRILAELEAFAAANLTAKGRYKVRLTLGRRKEETGITATRIPSVPASEPLRVCRARQPLSSQEFLRSHKTTRRGLYDRVLAEASGAGFDEVVFCNERGEVTEGAVSNVIIRKNGRYYTPPLSSGLLNGIYRKYFLETRPDAEERVLSLRDIERADCLFVCNSVRGLRRAVFSDEIVG
ncbi:aminodeoxychorismate synthase, component I [Prosthecochloris sp. GSB1]|nr:aminodeoxychorismate synthase, component I [Prosthecochloris sp. GSB1]